ncbi:MAG: hypothetical protein M4D80_35170 [Myxococcota bacterium]|nr:hypothetical protein [Myxococcota bacterium]
MRFVVARVRRVRVVVRARRRPVRAGFARRVRLRPARDVFERVLRELVPRELLRVPERDDFDVLLRVLSAAADEFFRERERAAVPFLLPAAALRPPLRPPRRIGSWFSSFP